MSVHIDLSVSHHPGLTQKWRVRLSVTAFEAGAVQVGYCKISELGWPVSILEWSRAPCAAHTISADLCTPYKARTHAQHHRGAISNNYDMKACCAIYSTSATDDSADWVAYSNVRQDDVVAVEMPVKSIVRAP